MGVVIMTFILIFIITWILSLLIVGSDIENWGKSNKYELKDSELRFITFCPITNTICAAIILLKYLLYGPKIIYKFTYNIFKNKKGTN